MRLILTLLVRDEADVVAATLDHHLDLGVDHVIATDNGSVDGTREILAGYRDRGLLTLIDEPDQTYEQAKWVTRMARLAATDHGADWVINADADEFFTPRDPITLKQALAGIPDRYDRVQAPRENMLADPRLPEETAWPERLVIRDLLSLHEKGGRIGNKVMHRADPEVSVAQGNHTSKTSAGGALWPGSPVTIYHVPDRGFAQYEHKIRVGGSSLAANTTLAPGSGWHWRADYERLMAGTLLPVWRSRQLDSAGLQAGLASGTLIYDVSLRDRLRVLARDLAARRV